MTDLPETSGIIVWDSLVILGGSANDPMISVYDVSGKLLAACLRKGRGPGETAQLLRLSPGDDATFQAAVDPESVFLYRFDSIAAGNRLPHRIYALPPGNHAFPAATHIGSGKLLYVGRQPRDANSKRYCIFDTNAGTVRPFGDYPSDDRAIREYPTDDNSKLTAYQGFPVLKPDRSKAVVIFYYAEGFEILDVCDPGVRKSVFYQYPQVDLAYIPEFKIHVVKRREDSFRGFLNAWCSDNAIYVLHSGKRFSDPSYGTGRYILKYDWDGEPLCLYRLDRAVSCFALDETESFLFAVSSGEDAVELLRYRMEGVCP